MRKSIVVLLFAALALVAGCGDDEGDDGGSGDDSATLTKAQYLEQGNEICAKYNKQLEDLFPQIPGQPGSASFDSFAEEKIVPVLETQISEVEALPAPEGDEDQVDEIFAAANEGLDNVREDPSAIAGDAFAEANQLANAYGLTECGS
jgi:hypothetical protein